MDDYKFTRATYMDTYNTDIARRATAGGILRQFNETATQNMSAFRPSYDELLDSGRALMVSRMDIEILDPPFMEEPIQVSTWPVLPKGAIIRRCYEMSKNGTLLARASSDWALVETASRQILRMTPETFPNYRYGDYVNLFDKKFHISIIYSIHCKISNPIIQNFILGSCFSFSWSLYCRFSSLSRLIHLSSSF